MILLCSLALLSTRPLLSCQQDAFNDQCYYLSDSLVLQAESVCGLTCQGRCPNHVNSDCTVSGDVCVVQADGYFDECISCAPSDFQSECMYMSDAMRAAAEVRSSEVLLFLISVAVVIPAPPHTHIP